MKNWKKIKEDLIFFLKTEVEKAGLKKVTVGLSGGCMQNITLATCIAKGLKQRGLTVLQHIGLPPNDGCIAYGQVSYGRHWLAVNKDKYSRV